MKLIRPTLLSAAAAALVATAHTASAQLQIDLTDPIESLYEIANEAKINDLKADGWRVVDVELWSIYGPSYYVVAVRNEAAYQKTWAFHEGLSEGGVQSLMSQSSRVIDVERYWSGTEYCWSVLNIANEGSDLVSGQGWRTDQTAAQVEAWKVANPSKRMIDLEAYQVDGHWRYAFVFINNIGSQQQSWGLDLSATPAEFDALMSSHRIVDSERRDAAGHRAVLYVDADEHPAYLVDDEPLGSTNAPRQFASRIVDFDVYRDASNELRQEFILRPNGDEITNEVSHAMRSQLAADDESGFLIADLQNPGWDGPSVMEDRWMEPGELINLAHHFHAMKLVGQGSLDLDEVMTEFVGTTQGCPDGTLPTAFTVRNVIRRAVQDRRATATEALRERFHETLIEATASAHGAFSIGLNHIIGCQCGSQANTVSLEHLAALFRAAGSGVLGDAQPDFDDLMNSVDEFGWAGYLTTTALDEELAASSLQNIDRIAFRNAVEVVHHRGAYTCSGGESHRAIGARVTVPYEEFCSGEKRDYFIGAYVNHAASGLDAERAVGAGVEALFRRLVRDAIESWETHTGCVGAQVYGASLPNSSGQRGWMNFSGTNYLHLNDFVVGAEQITPGQMGLLLVSPEEGHVAFPGGSAGNLLLGGPIGRYAASVQNSGSTGTFVTSIDWNAVPGPNGPFQAQYGDTLHFQWWHRDASATGAPTSNFTNGLRVHLR